MTQPGLAMLRTFLRSGIAPVLVALAVPLVASADELRLRSGQTLEGIVRQEPGKVVIETGLGTLSFPADDVQEVVPKKTAIEEYPARLAALGSQPKAAAVFDLAMWAQDHGLIRYVEPLLERTISLDPHHVLAHKLLGQVLVQGHWVGREEIRSREEVLMKGLESARARRRATPPAHPRPEIDPGYVYFGIPPMAPPRGSQVHSDYGIVYPYFHGVGVMP